MTLTAKKLPGHRPPEFGSMLRSARFMIDLVFAAKYAFSVLLGGVDGAFARAPELFHNPRLGRNFPFAHAFDFASLGHSLRGVWNLGLCEPRPCGKCERLCRCNCLQRRSPQHGRRR